MQLQLQASQSKLNENGVVGTQLLLAPDDNKIVTSTNMKVGSYTVAAQPTSLARISITHTTVTGTDTLGTITITGTDKDGVSVSEEVTPVADSTVYTTQLFKTVATVVGADWVINTTEDTVIVGVDYSEAPPNHYWFKLVTIAQAVVNSQTAVAGAVTADLTALTNLPALSSVHGKWDAIDLTSGEVIGYLARK